MTRQKLVTILLRISIASVFLYASAAATLEPYNWIGYLPQFAIKLFPANILLFGFSTFQAILAVWILTGWKAFYSSVIASITLLAIIFVNFSQLDVLFRDFAIFFTAVALAVKEYTPSKK